MSFNHRQTVLLPFTCRRLFSELCDDHSDLMAMALRCRVILSHLLDYLRHDNATNVALRWRDVNPIPVTTDR